MIDKEPRCWKCDRRLAEYLARPWSLACRRCHAKNKSEPIDRPTEMD